MTCPCSSLDDVCMGGGWVVAIAFVCSSVGYAVCALLAWARSRIP